MSAISVGVALALTTTGTAEAWSTGVNRVQTAQEDSAAGVGYGPGWVLLSYKANGPMVGYAFAKGFQFANGTTKQVPDHMDIRGTGNSRAGSPDIDRWPWGYSGGSFRGCAYAYGTAKFASVRKGFATKRCVDGPKIVGSSNADGSPDALRYWVDEKKTFCTDPKANPLCSPWGVWSENKGGGLKVTRTTADCAAYGDIGATAVYRNGPAVRSHLLGTVPANQQIDVRYVTKNGEWIMGKWHGNALAGGIRWAFFSRSCVAS
ncbi:hypothetical protein FKR81_20690 [Lentzea tibetensis]|uniref:Uncharacterized protein n=1 Tax=Lentzea tibetensis TaxID=2591470 RepID=A0A563ESD5_9PSEU|nr:hypothetical protein [Lentzea tibetensis]TWP50586.1 hypothetical protein FKR81_20690 [Lentzea tibetensis]